MAQKRKSPAARNTAPKVEIKETPVIIGTPVIVEPTAEEKPLVPDAPKVTKDKELSPTAKWNATRTLLIKEFPIFTLEELDIVCPIEDMKAHIRLRLSMTDGEIAAIIPGY